MRVPSAICALVLVGACDFQRSAPGGPGDDPAPAADAPGTGGSGSGSGAPADAPPCPDGDNDGICDAMDTWKCGAAKPPNPPNVAGAVFLTPNPSNVAGASIDGDGPVVMVAPGQPLELDYAYGIQLDCPGALSCRAQIEYGLDATRVGCLFDGTVNDNQFRGELGREVDLVAPVTPGVYRVRAKVALQAGGCGTSTSFTGGVPPDQQTIAIICVPP